MGPGKPSGIKLRARSLGLIGEGERESDLDGDWAEVEALHRFDAPTIGEIQ
jgi:hypothetical protein